MEVKTVTTRQQTKVFTKLNPYKKTNRRNPRLALVLSHFISLEVEELLLPYALPLKLRSCALFLGRLSAHLDQGLAFLLARLEVYPQEQTPSRLLLVRHLLERPALDREWQLVADQDQWAYLMDQEEDQALEVPQFREARSQGVDRMEEVQIGQEVRME